MTTVNTSRLRIGEVANQANINTKTIRYYESIGLLPQPARLQNGYRVYKEQDVSRVRFIRRAQGMGLSLDAIRDILHFHSAGDRPCRHVSELAGQKVEVIDQQIAELQRLRKSLAQLAERAALVEDRPDSDTTEICPAVEIETAQ